MFKNKILEALEGKEFSQSEFRDKDFLYYKWRNSWFGVANMVMFVGLSIYMLFMFSDVTPKTLERIKSDKGLLFIGMLLLCMQVLGIYHIYNILVGVVNRTSLRLEQGFLVASRGPLPWVTSCRRIELSEIRSVLIKPYKMLGIRNRIKYYKIVLDAEAGAQILERRIPHERDAIEIRNWVDEKIKNKVQELQAR